MDITLKSVEDGQSEQDLLLEEVKLHEMQIKQIKKEVSQDNSDNLTNPIPVYVMLSGGS